jgi:tetratricopeptide (TPR) repeat protein/DNA-binding XRE family transcriptional regulator
MPAKLGRRDDLGVAVTVLRWLKGWDQETLAAASGINLDSIKAIEQGRRRSSPKTLGPILASLGFSLEALAEVRALLRSLRARVTSGAAVMPPPAAADLRGQILALLAPPAAPVRPAGPAAVAASRQAAPALWERFRACSEPGQLDLAREAAEFQTAGFVELLCEQSRKAAGDSAARALHLARCAVLAAVAVPGSEGWRSRVQGYAQAHLANADRVGGDLNAADRDMAHGKQLWQAGAGDDPGLLNAARVLHLEASLRREQRRLPEALALLDQALDIDRWGETPTLLMGKARALEELGRHEAAIALLHQVDARLDRQHQSRDLFVVRAQLVSNLCHLGRHAEAEVELAAPRALARQLGNRLDLLRVDWLQGRVAAGRGRAKEAIDALGRVRAAFIAQDNAYDTALVTLELAEVYATLGRTAEVKALARESAPVFEHQGVHREARQALELFRRAAEEERATAELVRRVVAYLYRSRHDARVRYPRRPSGSTGTGEA